MIQNQGDLRYGRLQAYDTKPRGPEDTGNYISKYLQEKYKQKEKALEKEKQKEEKRQKRWQPLRRILACLHKKPL